MAAFRLRFGRSLTSEAGGGVVLMAAAVLALVVANSGLGPGYVEALHTPLGPLSLHQWINDALMSLFFLLVGLEIKREFVDGRLSSWADRRLPVIAAAAGMIVPALIYLGVVAADPALARGWAVPAATDIAFALGVLALLGPRAPASLKLFLTTVAIIDDLGAVAIIAVGYTAALNALALVAASAIWCAMLLLNRRGETRLRVYLLPAAGLWMAVFLSGVHATVAGVLAALAVPIRRSPGQPDRPDSPLHRLERALQPWVAFLALPVFGFANAGVSLAGIGVGELLAPAPLGVALALFVGKQVGVFGSVRIAVALGWGARPAGATWAQVYGVALLCGIGFTMSLFINDLAFADPALADSVKIGVLTGSVMSALAGYALLRVVPGRSARPPS